MNIILIGPPGSGKGTQASLISEKYNLANISTGDILRSEVKKESTVGLMAKRIMEEGRLVPDELVLKIIESRILEKDCNNGFILDGFPRNEKQAQHLDKMLKENKKTINLVLVFEIEESKLQERLLNRIYCKSCGAINAKPISAIDINNEMPLKCLKCGSDEGFFSRSDDNEMTIKTRMMQDKLLSDALKLYYKKNHSNCIFYINADKSTIDVSLEIGNIFQNLQ